jgi:hypothetical protein
MAYDREDAVGVQKLLLRRGEQGQFGPEMVQQDVRGDQGNVHDEADDGYGTKN